MSTDLKDWWKVSEKWRDVKGYEGLYEVSEIGNVRNKKTKRNLSTKNNDGYRAVTLSKNGKANGFLVHRLVAIAFIPNTHSKPRVNHKDSNRTNNRVSNLEWCTAQENIDHANEMGRTKYKFLSQEQVDEIRLLHKKGKLRYDRLAELYSVSETTIYNVIERKGRYVRM
jgi:hypothetical protein